MLKKTHQMTFRKTLTTTTSKLSRTGLIVLAMSLEPLPGTILHASVFDSIQGDSEPGVELADNTALPSDRGAGESDFKIVVQFKRPLTIPASRMTGTGNKYSPGEKEGQLFFQNGQWIPQAEMNLIDGPVCALNVFHFEMHGGWDVNDSTGISYAAYEERRRKEIFTDITIQENSVIFDINYTWTATYKGQTPPTVTAQIPIQRWVNREEKNEVVTWGLGNNRGDKIHSIIIQKQKNQPTTESHPSDLEITVRDLKSCFGADNLSVRELPADFVVP